jgi:hypothetical protein
MENNKQLTEEEIDLMFERFRDNITVGDPNEMTPLRSDNFKWSKEKWARILESLRNHQSGYDATQSDHSKSH